MGVTSLKDDQKELEITSTSTIPTGNAFIEQMNHSLDEFNKGVALANFNFSKIGTSTDFSYVITTKDGRIWTQVIHMLDPEVEMNFTVPGFWKEESEFAKHRAVRGTCIHLAKTLGVTKVECTWF